LTIDHNLGYLETPMLAELKGPARVIACVMKEGQRAEIVQFLDQSWGVRRNGSLLILWEPHEKRDCIQFFVQLAHLDEEEKILMVIPRIDRAACLTVDAALACD
jgi:hypothetical protein